MPQVTYYFPEQKILYAVTHPNEWVLIDIAEGLKKIGAIVRVWNTKKELIL